MVAVRVSVCRVRAPVGQRDSSSLVLGKELLYREFPRLMCWRAHLRVWPVVAVSALEERLLMHEVVTMLMPIVSC